MTTYNTLASTSPFTQLTFLFPESEVRKAPNMECQDATLQVAPDNTAAREGRFRRSTECDGPSTIPIGIEAPIRSGLDGATAIAVKDVRIPKSSSMPVSSAPRRNKPEHISDLLLVVLDRYGIDPSEFMAGL